MKRALFGLVAASLLSLTALGVSAAPATPTKVVVTEEDVTRQVENTPPTDNWVLYTRVGTPPSSAVFRTGPATPPSGIGSLELKTLTGSEKVFLFNYDQVGKKLADIDAISYSTYRTAGSGFQVAALNIQVDINGGTLNPGEFTTLVFEPVYNTNQGTVVNNQWQSWDAYQGGNAIWWSSRPIPGVCASSCFVTWNTILTNNPNATIVGGFGVNQGSGNPGLVTSVDALTIGYMGANPTVFDFEPYRIATSADGCKNGGWQTAKRADGSSFKNQGDCIQFVNTGK